MQNTHTPMRPVALVTGAGSGIGAATVDLLAAAGHDLILVARRADRLEHLAGVHRAAGARVEVLPADLSTAEGLARVAERADVGDVDLLVSNAGASAYRPLTAFDPTEIDGLWRLNATAHITLTRAVLPAMQARGTGGVITVASLLAFSAAVDLGFPRALYVAAKAALVGLTRSLALELRGSGVTATVVCPGLVDTDWSGGANHGDPRAMPADDVARALWTAHRNGEPICVPGIADPQIIEDWIRTEPALLEHGNHARLAPRYQAHGPHTGSAPGQVDVPSKRGFTDEAKEL